METTWLSLNFTTSHAKPREETLNGREYLVVPATLIVPGVLEGSQGALLYPPEEVSLNVEAWNHMPMVVYHPQNQNGNHISAKRPDVLREWGIGLIFATNVDKGPLESEAWFDILNTEKVDKRLQPAVRILPRVRRGEPIELSTGLLTDNYPVPAGSVFNGRSYDFIARNYRPDHVAVLPDQKGACSVNDGCGISVVNEDDGEFEGWIDSLNTALNADDIDPDKACQILEDGTVKGHELTEAQRGLFGAACGKKTHNTRGEPMKKKLTKPQMIDFLVANCDCWKGKNAKTVLNGFDDETLDKHVTNTRKLLVVNQLVAKGAKAVIANADGEGDGGTGVDIAGLAEFLGITTDPASDPVGFVKELQGALDQIRTKLGGDAPAPEPTVAEDIEPDEEDVTVMSEGGEGNDAVVGNNKTKKGKGTVQNKKPQTAQEWLKGAPVEIRSAVQNAMRVERDERHRIIRQLVANVDDENKQKALVTRLLKKDLTELRELASLIPTANEVGSEPDELTVFFQGGAGGASGGGGGGYLTGGLTENEANDVLDIESARQEYDPIITNKKKAQ